MSEYRKGRVLVLLGMLGFSTVSVLVGTAGADAGTIKVKSVIDSSVSTSNGNEPHVSSGCVSIMADFATLSVPTFTSVSPTDSAPLTVKSTPSATTGETWWSVTATNAPAGAASQGYHVKVTLDGKTKVFWVAANAPGCSGDPGVVVGTGPSIG